MNIAQKLKFIFFRIIHSKLAEKILLFTIIQVIIQSLPLLIESIWHKIGTHSVSENAQIVTMFFLAGTAWISVPSFISQYEWKKIQSRIFKLIAYFIGIGVTLYASYLEIAVSQNQPSRFALQVMIWLILLLAVFYISLTHYILLKKVSIRLLWIHQAQFAGIYCAKYAGIFEKHGLSVQINEANDTHPVNDFDASKDDFSIVAGIDVIRMLQNGNQKIKSILPLVKTNPFIVVAKEKSGIKSIEDLQGKKIGIHTDYETEIYFKAFVKLHGIDPANFKYVKASFDPDEFINSDTDAIIGYTGCEPVHCRQKLIKITEFEMSGKKQLDGYADTIVVEESTLKNEKQSVRSFVDAVIQGWEFAKQNKEIAVLFVMHLAKLKDASFHGKFLNRILTLLEVNGKLGDEQRIEEWQQMIDFLVEMEVIPKDHKVKANKIVYDI